MWHVLATMFAHTSMWDCRVPSLVHSTAMLRSWAVLGLASTIGIGRGKGLGYAFTPSPTCARGSARIAGVANRYPRLPLTTASSFRQGEGQPDVAPNDPLTLSIDGEINMLYRQALLASAKLATRGVKRYFKPDKEQRSLNAERGSTSTAEALESQLGELVDTVLCMSSDEENGKSVGAFLDRCEEQSGTGATLSLSLLDAVWSMPHPIRPDIGDKVFVAVYAALRRYGVFKSYGALTPPDVQVPPVSQERSKYVKAMASSPSFAAIGFMTGAQNVWLGIMVVLWFILTLAGLRVIEMSATKPSLIILAGMITEREVLNGAVYDEIIQRLQPDLTKLTSVHEAGHLLMSYLVGSPVPTYTLGGVASIRHGRSLGSAPSIVSVDPELTIARAAKNGGRLVGLGGHRDSVTQELINRNTFNSEPLDVGGASQASMTGAEDDTKEAQSARHAMSNRYALTMMGGVAAETVVNGFGVGGVGDQFFLASTLADLWPSISANDLRSTEQWAVLEATRVLRAERETLELVAKNMRETRQIGRVLLDVERTLGGQDFRSPDT